MSHSKVQASGWSPGQLLLSTEISTIDENVSNSVDKRAGHLEIDSVSTSRFATHPWIPDTTTDWAIVAHAAQAAVATAATVRLLLRLPNGATLTGLSVYIQAAPAHAGLPANKPTCQLHKISASGTTTQIGTTITDAPADTTAYQASHILGPSGGAGPTLSGLSEVIDNTTYVYRVSVSNESSTNALSGLVIRRPLWVCTVTKLDHG